MSAVGIVNFSFMPAELAVAPGTTLTWTNNDDAAHTIKDTSVLNTPESPTLAKGATFAITYTKAARYPYICGIHNYMTGTVIVKS